MIIAFITGTFLELLIILSIVFIHESGHYLMARVFKWRIRKVMLWIFGGVMDTDEHGNRPIYEEALVTIAGPFQHLLIYGLAYFLSIYELLPGSVITLIFFYNTTILIFNLLPIWPLDGGKFLFLLFSKYLPFKKAYDVIILFSIVTCICFLVVQLVFFPFTLSAFLVMLFLIMENRSEWKKRYYVFIRFLLKRYENSVSIKHIQPIVVPHQTSLMDIFTQFRREKRHYIYITFPGKQRKALDESECLKSYFYDKQYNKSIGEIVTYSV